MHKWYIMYVVISKNKQVVNMKKPVSSKKRLLLLLVTITIALAIGATLFWRFTVKDDNSKDLKPKYTVSANESQSSGGSAKTETPAKDTDAQTSSVTSEQVPVAPAGAITIVDLDQADGYVNAKATVSNFTPTSCVYTFTSDGADKPVIRTLDGTCDGISIPEVEFQYIGTYTLAVTAYNGTSEKITASKDIVVQ